jgi:hypothetical protein
MEIEQRESCVVLDLNFSACVCTVTENPRTPKVLRHVQHTEYLREKVVLKRYW